MKAIGDIVASEPLEVSLFVCPACRERGIATVGKLPQGMGSKFAAFCTGPPGSDHKRTAMKPRPFREVVE